MPCNPAQTAELLRTGTHLMYPNVDTTWTRARRQRGHRRGLNFRAGVLRPVAAHPCRRGRERGVLEALIATTEEMEHRGLEVSCLLPQAHVFEGFLLGLVERERRLLAVSNRDQPGASSLHLHSVPSA
jgi:hypothetical protein